jgi:hypothetical protein
MKKAFKLLAIAWAVIIGMALIMYSQSGVIIHSNLFSRIAAFILLISIIAWIVVELGWGGGEKSKSSHDIGWGG